MVLNCGTNSTALCVKCLCIHADRIRTFVACLVTHRPRLSCSFLVWCSFSLSVYMFVFFFVWQQCVVVRLAIYLYHPHHPVSERNFWYYCSCIVSCTHRVIFISHTSLSPHPPTSPSPHSHQHTQTHTHSPYHLTPHPKITFTPLHTSTHHITHSLNTPVHERYNNCYPLCHILPIVPRQHIVTPPKIIYT